MADTKQLLTTALLRKGATKLAEVWDCSTVEAGRRINDERGIKLSDLAAAFDSLNIQILDPGLDLVVIRRDELQALNLLAHRYLDRRCNGEEAREDE